MGPSVTVINAHPQVRPILRMPTDRNAYSGERAPYGANHFSERGLQVYEQLIDQWNHGIHPPYVPHHVSDNCPPSEHAWSKINSKWKLAKKRDGFQ